MPKVVTKPKETANRLSIFNTQDKRVIFKIYKWSYKSQYEKEITE